jgi:hypothetical protein
MKCKITLQERLKDLRVVHNLNLDIVVQLSRQKSKLFIMN